MSEAIIYGIHAVSTLLARAPQQLLTVFIQAERTDRRLQLIITDLQSQGIAIQRVKRKVLDHKVAGAVHQGIVAEIRSGRSYNEQDIPQLIATVASPLVLVLDGITDPHNLGACLRSADAAGVHAVIVPRDRSSPINATVRKVACGAADALPLVRVTNLARTLCTLQAEGIWVVGTSDQASQTLYQMQLTGPLALVMGAEGHGMRRLTTEQCDVLVRLPMAGALSALNVSVATGIALFEAVRQRANKVTHTAITPPNEHLLA